MNRFVTKKGWAALERGSLLSMHGRRKLTVRCNMETDIYLVGEDLEPLLVGRGLGEIELDIHPDGDLRFDTDGHVWVLEPEQNQDRRQLSDTVYTSLDRPPPLSPEMAAIQRMMRQNELERERDREMMKELQNDRRRMAARSSSESSSRKGAAEDPAPVGQNTDASSSNPEQPQGGGDTESIIVESSRTVASPKPAK